MRHLLGTIAAIILVAAATGLVCYRLNAEPALHAAAAKRDALQWLRDDFHLTPAQFTAIRELHASYAGTCSEHCRMIQEATQVRAALAATQSADPAAVAAAERKVQELRAVCESAIATHVWQVAALMTPAEGQRYLALVLPKIADFDHTAVPDLRLNRQP
jgi:hypothetical protein